MALRGTTDEICQVDTEELIYSMPKKDQYAEKLRQQNAEIMSANVQLVLPKTEPEPKATVEFCC